MAAMESVAGLAKKINQISNRFAPWQVFTDFLECTAIAISNSVDKPRFEEREKRYLEIAKKYDKKDFDVFPEILAELVEIMDKSVQQGEYPDFLGTLFHEMDFHDVQKGQFFTPQDISNFMADMTFNKDTPKQIEEQGYISAHDCACGSGAMMLGAARAVRRLGYNPSKHLFVVADDLDISCTWMVYIQLSLYGIPAIVNNGNTLTRELFDTWLTPIFICDGWHWKLKNKAAGKERVDFKGFFEDMERLNIAAEPTDIQIEPEPKQEPAPAVIEFAANEEGQLELF